MKPYRVWSDAKIMYMYFYKLSSALKRAEQTGQRVQCKVGPNRYDDYDPKCVWQAKIVQAAITIAAEQNLHSGRM